jgi:tetratricopeptide (TPR) repeat protein
LKRPRDEQLDDRLARTAVATDELTRVSVCMVEADRLYSAGEPGKAADLLNEFMQLGNRDLRAHALHKQIWFLISAKRLDEAEHASNLLLSTDNRAEYFWQQSVLMHALGRNEAAIDAARASVARAPTNSQYQQHLGTVLLAANNLDEAEQAIVLACTLSPLNAISQHRLSMLRLRQKRLEEAIVAAEHAVTLAPDNPQFAAHLEKLHAIKKGRAETP